MPDVQWDARANQTIRSINQGSVALLTDFSRDVSGTIALPALPSYLAQLLGSDALFQEWVHRKFLRGEYTVTTTQSLSRKP